MATCSKCGTIKNLFVWFIPDPYNDYPLSPEVICGSCPGPKNIFKDNKSAYDPDFHDYILRIKDYQVNFSYAYCGLDDVKGICFECDSEVNMSNGYGHVYLPDSYCNTSVVYCQNCYRKRCQHHIDFTQEEEVNKLTLKLENYQLNTRNGKLK